MHPNILPHDSYLINLGHPEAKAWQKSALSLMRCLRCEQLGLDRLNFHPGSHLNAMAKTIAWLESLKALTWRSKTTHGVTAVIENTAG